MLKRLLKPQPRKLAIDQNAFETQALDFLDEYGFEPNPENLKLFGSFIQHSSENEDSFDPELMAKRIRKAHANACAFYLMYPERKPKAAPEATPADEVTVPNGLQEGQ